MPRLRSLAPRIAPAPSRLPSTPKEAAAHYQTPEHRAWAADVIRRAGGRCQWPGCTKGAPEHRMFADHITELSDGGAALDPANGQCLCGAHHSAKTAAARAARLAKPIR